MKDIYILWENASFFLQLPWNNLSQARPRPSSEASITTEELPTSWMMAPSNFTRALGTWRLYYFPFRVDVGWRITKKHTLVECFWSTTKLTREEPLPKRLAKPRVSLQWTEILQAGWWSLHRGKEISLELSVVDNRCRPCSLKTAINHDKVNNMINGIVHSYLREIA